MLLAQAESNEPYCVVSSVVPCDDDDDDDDD